MCLKLRTQSQALAYGTWLSDFALLDLDLPPEDPPLVSRFSYCKDVFDSNREIFLKKYKELHGKDFVF